MSADSVSQLAPHTAGAAPQSAPHAAGAAPQQIAAGVAWARSSLLLHPVVEARNAATLPSEPQQQLPPAESLPAKTVVETRLTPVQIEVLISVLKTHGYNKSEICARIPDIPPRNLVQFYKNHMKVRMYPNAHAPTICQYDGTGGGALGLTHKAPELCAHPTGLQLCACACVERHVHVHMHVWTGMHIIHSKQWIRRPGQGSSCGSTCRVTRQRQQQQPRVLPHPLMQCAEPPWTRTPQPLPVSQP